MAKLTSLPTPNTAEHFREWCLGLVLDNGQPFVLEDFQMDVVSDLFAGYPEIWFVVPEENGKTTLVSALGLYHIRYTPSAWVPIAASSRDQAEILYRQADGFVKRSDLDDQYRCLEGYRRIRYDDGNSRIQIFAADDRTGDGVIPTLCIIDELHRHRDLRLYRTWRGKLGKRGGQIVTISTAGEPGSEFEATREAIRQGALEKQRNATKTYMRAATRNLVLHEWALPEKADPEDLEMVKAANPFSGITVERLQDKLDSPTMTMEHWRRFVCNLPTRSSLSAITEQEWHDATAKKGEQIPPGESIWVGLDVAWKWDTTAIVPFWMKDREHRYFGEATVLVPPRDGRMLEVERIERAFVEIHHRNPIHTVVMDISGAQDLARWLAEEFECRVIDRPQTHTFAAREYEAFMEGLRMGWIKHQGDQVFTQHALNAIARLLPLGDAIFDRPSRTRQGGNQDVRVIDALKAAAMVNEQAITPEKPTVEPLVAVG